MRDTDGNTVTEVQNLGAEEERCLFTTTVHHEEGPEVPPWPHHQGPAFPRGPTVLLISSMILQ